VTVKLDQKLSWIRNNILIGKGGGLRSRSLEGTTIVRPGILWIAILFELGLLTEGLGEVLLASAIVQASVWSARTMKHVLGDCGMKLRVLIWVRNLGRDEGIHLFNSANFVVLPEKDKKVHMRKATLLILDSVHLATDRTKVAIIDHF